MHRRLHLFTLFAIIASISVGDCYAQQPGERVRKAGQRVVVTHTTSGIRLAVPSAAGLNAGASSEITGFSRTQRPLNVPDMVKWTPNPAAPSRGNPLPGAAAASNSPLFRAHNVSIPQSVDAHQVPKPIYMGGPDVNMAGSLSPPTLSIGRNCGSVTPLPPPSIQVPALEVPKSSETSASPVPDETVAGPATGDSPGSAGSVSPGPGHPRYQARITKNNLEEDNHLNFGIIGIQWSRMSFPTVIRVFPDTPAERAGILAADQLLAINSNSLVGLSVEEITGMIIGPPGTTVILSIRRLDRLSAAVLVRMDVDAIKDPLVRESYGRTLNKLVDSNDPSSLRF